MRNFVSIDGIRFKIAICMKHKFTSFLIKTGFCLFRYLSIILFLEVSFQGEKKITRPRYMKARGRKIYNKA